MTKAAKTKPRKPSLAATLRLSAEILEIAAAMRDTGKPVSLQNSPQARKLFRKLDTLLKGAAQ